MKVIKLNAVLVLSYLEGELTHNDAISVEEALLRNPEWLRVVEYFKEHEQEVKASLTSLNQQFDKLLEKDILGADMPSELHVKMGNDELIVAYANDELDTTQSFQFEERLLEDPSLNKEYESYLKTKEGNKFNDTVQHVNNAFEKELSTENEETKQRSFYPNLVRWVGVAAAVAVFLFVTKAVYDSNTEPTYYTLGDENSSEVSVKHQEILNLHNVFSNKLERLVRFGALVSAEERDTFAKDLQEFCSVDAFVIVEQEGETKEYSLNQFIEALQSGSIQTCSLVESEIEKGAALLFFTNNEGFKVNENGEVLIRENSSYNLSETEEGKLLISKFKVKC